jgi:2-oxoglutarate ferredoxin oxidoreductase subunit beta
MTAETAKVLTKADFESDQEVRWCPGCGDYAILAAVQKLVPTLGIPKEKFVFISGIGCSSRFPYYMNTYGFHTIHGRALSVATGLKIANPDLSVWVVTGDGDSLSIGGNHFIHTLRRNLDINVLLFNNKIYGLTKGQYSPTSEQGKKTKSTPYGSLDYPINAASLAIAANATFVARSFDVNTPHLIEVLRQAQAHRGMSFVEIYQNCNIFNDGAYAPIVDRPVRADGVVELVNGQPLKFGKEMNKGIRIQNNQPEVVTIGENGITEKDLYFHDETLENPSLPYMLSQMEFPRFPVPMGVLRNINRPSYEAMVHEQNRQVIAEKGTGSLEKLIVGRDTWEIK